MWQSNERSTLSKMQGQALPEASSFRMYSILSKKMFLIGWLKSKFLTSQSNSDKVSIGMFEW